MQIFEAPALPLHGCPPGHPLLRKRNSPCRADEQRESVSGAKPRFCEVISSMGQDAPMRME